MKLNRTVKNIGTGEEPRKHLSAHSAGQAATDRLALGFGKLNDKGQEYIKDLTAKLVKIHKAAPGGCNTKEKR